MHTVLERNVLVTEVGFEASAKKGYKKTVLTGIFIKIDNWNGDMVWCGMCIICNIWNGMKKKNDSFFINNR